MVRRLVEGLFKSQPVADESPPAKETMMEDQNDISLTQLCLSNESDGEVDGENGDNFPFPALPDELIGHIFSFLSIEDRLRARVNRRMNKIESENKYYVDKLVIKEGSKEKIALMKDRGQDHDIYFVKGVSYSSKCIKRLTQNLSVGYLYIMLENASDFHREVYNSIKNFDVETLGFYFSHLNRELENEMMVDSFFLDLTRTCKTLDLWSIDNITPEALYQVYKMMVNGSTKLREMVFENTNNQIAPFLELIGITYRDERFVANREIEGIEYHIHDDTDYSHHARLFDGNLEICINHSLLYDENDNLIWASEEFSLKLYDSEESLYEANKVWIGKGFTSINFGPE